MTSTWHETACMTFLLRLAWFERAGSMMRPQRWLLSIFARGLRRIVGICWP